MFFLAAILTSYPFIANWVFEHRTDSFVNLVEESADEVDNEEKEKMLEEARKYNEIIASGKIQLKDPFAADVLNNEAGEYQSLLCMAEEGVMGFVEIPSIDIKLPVYHGTDASVLEKGVGHLEGTSLPIGGPSTHTVLTGHTGLSSAKLFTDLTELEKGDYFFLEIVGDRYAYQVDQIKTVLPTSLSDLQVETGQDFCTLVTCTPYGVNTHRLLVRGVRSDYQEIAEKQPEVFEKKKVESKWMAEYRHALWISFATFFVALALYFGLSKCFGCIKKSKTKSLARSSSKKYTKQSTRKASEKRPKELKKKVKEKDLI